MAGGGQLDALMLIDEEDGMGSDADETEVIAPMVTKSIKPPAPTTFEDVCWREYYADQDAENPTINRWIGMFNEYQNKHIVDCEVEVMALEMSKRYEKDVRPLLTELGHPEWTPEMAKECILHHGCNIALLHQTHSIEHYKITARMIKLNYENCVDEYDRVIPKSIDTHCKLVKLCQAIRKDARMN